MKTRIDAPYIALGRTKRAWATHSKVMIDAERIANQKLAKIFGFSNEVDFTAGSCLMSEDAAKIILKHSTEPTNATDLEWPAIIFKYLNVTPRCLLTEGLEFETADYYEDEIKKVGSKKAWAKLFYENPNQRKARQKLTQDSVKALNRVLETT